MNDIPFLAFNAGAEIRGPMSDPKAKQACMAYIMGPPSDSLPLQISRQSEFPAMLTAAPPTPNITEKA